MDDLSTDQIVSLFSGKYATWKDLDPSLPDEKVVVITRDINGGAHEVFQKNIMGDTEVSSDAIQASSMGELVQDIIDNQYAIGYASFGVANQNAGKVVTMKVNGVEPTKEISEWFLHYSETTSYCRIWQSDRCSAGISGCYPWRDRTEDCRRYGIHSNEIEKWKKGVSHRYILFLLMYAREVAGGRFSVYQSM